MRYITKKVRLLEMTQEEMRALVDLVQSADRGQMVNAAETRLADGSYLAVAKVENSGQMPPEGSDRKVRRDW